ncbi:MAG: nuclear transport factor 2 family protein [Verrucomicrobiales bacterium]|nr:nuclear transport factor 2 family protein [Verrucomicrobiales bacterium]
MLLVCVLLAASVPLGAQEWSAAQKEVWESVERYWEAGRTKDLDKVMACVHEDYLGWDNRDPLPITKGDLGKWLKLQFETVEVLLMFQKPVGIRTGTQMCRP